MKIYVKIFIFLLFITHANFNSYASSDTRKISQKPKEIYGTASRMGLAIGNGGAGPTGILKALSEDFLKQTHHIYSIAWYQDISPNTLKQLKNNVIDIALVYEKDQGDQAIMQGFATNYTVIFNDHFIIVGPKENQARLSTKDSVRGAFKKISEYGDENLQNIFLSRDDNSATNVKEKAIWNAISLEPWANENQWYYKFHAFPKDALIEADVKHLYTITDMATFFSNKSLLKNSEIYIRGGDLLLNPCFALLQKNPSKNAIEFLEYLKSKRAQNLIEDFGKEKFGQPLFTKANQKEF